MYIGIKEIGIFRLPGQQTRITELRELFNQGMYLHTSVKFMKHGARHQINLAFFFRKYG